VLHLSCPIPNLDAGRAGSGGEASLGIRYGNRLSCKTVGSTAALSFGLQDGSEALLKRYTAGAPLQPLRGPVDRGALMTVPARKSQKPRRVIAAALAEHGAKVLLYLSAKPADLEHPEKG